MKNFKLLAVLGLVILGSASLAACNTVDGMGQDIERGGEAVQDAAN